ncbi:MAG: hypothetical protein WCF04_15575 [Candidatus Nanopelagicales bacterium]
MATISLLSAKGAPGVTTTTVALALAWRESNPGRSAIAVDADPIGGDTAAGVLCGALARPAGLMSLAVARSADPMGSVAEAAVDLRPDGAARLLPGVPDEARSGALVLAWEVLRSAQPVLDDSRTDLIVDAGRVGRGAVPAPWLAGSDLVVLLVRPTLPAVTAAHRFAVAWPLAAVPLHLVVIDAPSPYRPDSVAEAVGLPLLGGVAFDPAHARVHSEGATPGRGFVRSAYARSLRRLAGDAGALVAGASVSMRLTEVPNGRV